MNGTPATLLTPEQVEHVHEASLDILETTGLLVRNPEARERLAHCGCRVDSETQIVTWPQGVVEEFRSAYPGAYPFHGRDPRYDRTIPDDGPLIMTASSAPNLLDPVTGEERRARSDDMARIAHLANELPGIDLFSVSVLTEDAPPGYFSLYRYYPALKNCVKPVRGNAPNVDEVRRVVELATIVAGGEDAYRERPLITHHYCPVVSPLTMDFDSTSILIYCVENGLPGYATVVPQAGLTSPMTLPGTLVQSNAEFLAWSTFTQMLRPGTPVIYSTLPTVGDLRTGAYAPGGIETGILVMGFVQMARFYGVPSAGYLGLTNAKIADAQAGFEKAMATMAGVLAGVDLINVSGLLDALMTFDYAMLAIDNELALMLKQAARGLEFSEEEMALEVIRETGPGGMFIDKAHTYQRMRTTALLPEIADRDSRRTWQEQGGLEARERAMRQVRAILTRANPAVLPGEIDARIRARFAQLCPGDATPPPGWEPPPPQRQRRTRRRARRGA